MVELKCYNVNNEEIHSLYQYDDGCQIYIRGITVGSNDSVYFDFSSGRYSNAITVQATRFSAMYVAYFATIPSVLLTQARPIWIYVVKETESGERITVGHAHIDVIKSDPLCET